MFSIRHPIRTWYGAGTVEKIREEAEFAGTKAALLFSDKGVIDAGIAERAIAPLRAAGIDVTVYDECSGEPAMDDLEGAYGQLRKEHLDMMV